MKDKGLGGTCQRAAPGLQTKERKVSPDSRAQFQGETSPPLRAEPRAACWLDLPNTRNYKLLCALHPSLWMQGFMVVVVSGVLGVWAMRSIILLVNGYPDHIWVPRS